MIEPLINIYYINLYGHYGNGYEPVYESDTIKTIKKIFFESVSILVISYYNFTGFFKIFDLFIHKILE
ncbi:MAG: hypothetical protein RXO36_04485 [Candidatus Nanopusillus acidilobi]|jgi:hypothetical protein